MRCNNKKSWFVQIWQTLTRQGAKSELALACFLVSVDKTRTLLEHAKNSKSKTPLDLLNEDSQVGVLTKLLKSYEYQSNNAQLE